MEEILTKFFNETFELLRECIAHGIPDIQIPALDPLKIPGKQEVQLESFFAYIDASFSNVEMTGLSSIDLPKIEIKDRKIQATTTTKQVQAKGDYTLNGHAIKFLTIASDSTFTCDIVSITVTIGLEITNKETDAFDPKAHVEVKFEDMKLNLDGLDHSKIVSKMVNSLLSSFSGMISKFLEKAIGQTMQQALQKLIDQHKDKYAAEIDGALKDLAQLVS